MQCLEVTETSFNNILKSQYTGHASSDVEYAFLPFYLEKSPAINLSLQVHGKNKKTAKNFFGCMSVLKNLKIIRIFKH